MHRFPSAIRLFETDSFARFLSIRLGQHQNSVFGAVIDSAVGKRLRFIHDFLRGQVRVRSFERAGSVPVLFF